MAVSAYDAWRGYPWKNEERFVNTQSHIVAKEDIRSIYPDSKEPWYSSEAYYSELWGDNFKKRGGTTAWDWRKLSHALAAEQGFAVDMSGGFLSKTEPLDLNWYVDFLKKLPHPGA